MIKVTKNNSFTLSLKNSFLEEPQNQFDAHISIPPPAAFFGSANNGPGWKQS